MKHERDLLRWCNPMLEKLPIYQTSQSNPTMIKLDAMEAPTQMSSQSLSALLQDIANSDLFRYPDPTASALQKSIREQFHLDPEIDLMFGNGSDELIYILFTALANPENYLITVAPSFFMYKQFATMVGSNYIEIPLEKNNFELNVTKLLETSAQYTKSTILLAQPNNPTGTLLNDATIRSILEQHIGPVIIDEAYFAYSGYNALRLMKDYQNLIVIRTLSKIGFAGIRLGMLFAHPQWVALLNKIRQPYNINTLTQLCAVHVLHAYPEIQAQIENIKLERDKILQGMQHISGITAWEGHGNFLLFRTTTFSANKVYTLLKEHNILVKDVSKHHNLLQNCLRVSIGTAKENNYFLDCLKKIMSTKK